MSDRIHVTLVDRTQWYRRPRSKKRRIIAKWRKDKRNYRPLMIPVEVKLALGSAYPDGPQPRIIEMHTALWERVKIEAPEFAAQCDVHRLVKRMFRGIEVTDSEPIPA